MEAQKDILSADTLAAIRWLGMPEGTPFPLAESKAMFVPSPRPETLADVELPPDEPDAWRDAFHGWVTTNCVFRDRCLGGIGCLHVHFCEWTQTHSTVTACTRQTFERLLADADFLLADGLVSGLILAEDWQAAHWQPEPPKIMPRRKRGAR